MERMLARRDDNIFVVGEITNANGTVVVIDALIVDNVSIAVLSVDVGPATLHLELLELQLAADLSDDVISLSSQVDVDLLVASLRAL